MAQMVQARLAVIGVMSGLTDDPTKGAIHYKRIGAAAKWADGKTPCITIGSHEFYNDIQ